MNNIEKTSSNACNVKVEIAQIRRILKKMDLNII